MFFKERIAIIKNRRTNYTSLVTQSGTEIDFGVADVAKQGTDSTAVMVRVFNPIDDCKVLICSACPVGIEKVDTFGNKEQ